MICSRSILFPAQVLVLFRTQNKVHSVADLVERLYNRSKLKIVDSSKFIYKSKLINEIVCKNFRSVFWLCDKYFNNKTEAEVDLSLFSNQNQTRFFTQKWLHNICFVFLVFSK